MKKSVVAFCILSALGLSDAPVQAFPHTAQLDETLAQLAQELYGDSSRESVLVTANSLDAFGGSLVQPGMRIEVPAPSFVRAAKGDTWPDLAKIWLGSKERAAWLARANGQKPWIPPAEGTEIRIPAVITHIASEGESILTLHKRFQKDIEQAWELNGYNFREGTDLKAGEVILIPLLPLELTPVGKVQARRMSQAAMGDFGSDVFQAQKQVDRELATLLTDTQGGRYLDVVIRGNALLALGPLSKVQQSQIYRCLLEAYAAFDARGAAAGACASWKALTTDASLDPRLLSPKIMRACE